MLLWDASKRAEVSALIKWLLPRRTQDRGWPADGITDVTLRELGCSATSRLPTIIVMRVLNELHKIQESSPEAFERAYDSLTSQQKAVPKQPVKRWTFFFPLKANLSTDLSRPARLRILDRTFLFLPTRSVERRLGKTSLNPRSLAFLFTAPLNYKVEIPPSFFAGSQIGTSPDDAWHLLIRAFDTLRGVIELVLNFGTLWISSEPKPRARFPHPDWMIIKATGQPIDGIRFVTEPSDSWPILTLSLKHFNAFSRLARLFAREPARDSTISLIADALRLYVQAMDEKFDHTCFLALWQLAETITLSESGRTDEVCKRLAWHGGRLKLPGSGFRNLLDHFAQKRNDIVHRGIREEVDYEGVNYMKWIFELALNWLINESRKLPTTQHLRAFYQLRTASDPVIEAYSEVARVIAKGRKSQPAQ